MIFSVAAILELPLHTDTKAFPTILTEKNRMIAGIFTNEICAICCSSVISSKIW
ncbi:hypothetical protein KsCSTR_10610 [Candidatus Kuenenia stuttgartiensis]|uniref:Uncharacterized protein n=1 Tax=Kuenenia stuttgartiensis TaxID=174633 RepID=Q1PYP9_KUEST|nr:hypothetical protein KsCSTR_10610 [Candidatus Kuenenia stuttgartiensis]CAJ72200.1 unknown protein [Candidatus Kuenenia stuttgartiensis]